MNIKVNSIIRVRLKDISEELKERIKRDFSYNNLEYNKIRGIIRQVDNKQLINPSFYLRDLRKKLSYRLKFTSPKIKSYRISDCRNYLFLPRGSLDKFINILKQLDIKYKVQSNKSLGGKFSINVKKNIKLSYYQKDAFEKLLKRNDGLLISPTASGKTRTMLFLVSQISRNTLIIVHTSEILKHWKNEIKKTFNIKNKDIGQLGIGKKNFRPITIAMIQTLRRLEKVDFDKINKYFGLVIISEVHHVPSDVTFRTVNKLSSNWRYGESASKTRKDGKEYLMFDLISDNIVEIPDEIIEKEKRFLIPTVNFIFMDNFEYDFFNDYTSMINELVENKHRNAIIIDEIKKDVEAGHKILVLSDRIKHCVIISKLLDKKKIKNCVIVGRVKNEERNKMIKDIDKKCDVIIATSALASEGINIPILSSLHLVVPSNNFELLKQRTGRIRRVCANKKAPEIKDYIDTRCKYLVNIYKRRMFFYKKLGYKV